MIRDDIGIDMGKSRLEATYRAVSDERMAAFRSSTRADKDSRAVLIKMGCGREEGREGSSSEI